MSTQRTMTAKLGNQTYGIGQKYMGIVETHITQSLPMRKQKKNTNDVKHVAGTVCWGTIRRYLKPSITWTIRSFFTQCFPLATTGVLNSARREGNWARQQANS